VVVLECAVHGRVVRTGRAYDDRVVSVITVKDRRVTHWRDCLDPVAVLRATRWPAQDRWRGKSSNLPTSVGLARRVAPPPLQPNPAVPFFARPVADLAKKAATLDASQSRPSRSTGRTLGCHRYR
jgi:hypothetical protein